LGDLKIGPRDFNRPAPHLQTKAILFAACFAICPHSFGALHSVDKTSDSLRVGEVQIGPEALSMAAVLNKELGLSHTHARSACWN
jgi:hypothetical protein